MNTAHATLPTSQRTAPKLNISLRCPAQPDEDNIHSPPLRCNAVSAAGAVSGCRRAVIRAPKKEPSVGKSLSHLQDSMGGIGGSFRS